MRRPIIAGNWKMNKTAREAAQLIIELRDKVKDAKCEVVVCPPFTSLAQVITLVEDTNIKVGAQNMYFEENGAFTGEVSPIMLKELGVEYVILGHSERRMIFKEDDELINKKVKAAFVHGLTPILCVGETLKEREENRTYEVIKEQLKEDLDGLDKAKVAKMVIAYEPVWAIGTGKTATAEDANDVIKFIRNYIRENFGNDAAEEIRIQYGGSVKPSTIKEQMAQSDIDGALVGGASLNATEFAAIVNYKED
ncbi:MULTISPECIES: triose-phosphate isomerase [Caloramator]|uniref:Triosephosphate isomerase n=1 Tax=Caloramator australicus RC3 TaxID=857293 RepID=I7LIH3_9CLOT|nr:MULTISPECIES: triose-phosphate isomerase [Caloramator]MDO6353869.1 triose-phosphate isomerase [Caloramator sp. CAR-1]CCJ32972.1 Triosephosphate isomerase [Caloramator australicus RC3]